jgi:outer membrane protease
MDIKANCDVCGKENDYFSFSENIGIVEKHYYCDNCGFFVEMSYSSEMRGMCVGYNDTKEEHDKTNKRIEYADKIKELGLQCYIL